MQRFAPLLLLVAVSTTLAQPQGDLPSRLSKAYATYCHQLAKEGRADELTMSTDDKLNAMDMWFGPRDSSLTGVQLRWFGPRDSTWKEVNQRVEFPNSALTGSLPGQLYGGNVDPGLPARDENEDCQNFVAARFQVAPGESLLFTMGHVVESCSDTPWMIARSGKKDSKYLLPDLLGYNVQALWYTGAYLILNIRVEFEYGSTFEGLAFWDLEQGWIHSVVAETHVGARMDADDPVRTDPTQGLGVYLRDLRKATFRESNRRVFMDHQGVKFAFRPDKQEWMALP